ncbi:hypothetical protein QVD17_37912 [Tagetes erecta]|uniref:Uncharacterized protein n=1 Tax=Tagetes erecta TaxID=13708 RepID=A0AAD8NIY6_TARER|nr:hypothetical protein QVD17_37912 [Tagetes erecta]
MNISPFLGSKICMPTFPLVRDASKELTCFGRINSLLVNRHKPKVIPSQVDVNKKIDKLKENTRRTLMMTSDPTKILELIDTIQRLGVGHYFHEEIKKMLEKLTQVLPDDDLYTTSLNFRLRRHNGLYTNPGVFQKFMDTNGDLMKSSSEDIEGLLSLYEASYLGSSGEDVLLHAREISTRHLNMLVSQLSPTLQKKVVEGLKLPRHMRMERLEARRFIKEYDNDNDHDPILLELAKYDYNMVQSVLQRELAEITRWWEDLDLCGNLGLVRDRHVECFLWTVGLLPEMRFSSSRIELAKQIAIMLVIDDIYDTYGSYDDLVLFTQAIQRWDLNATRQLPEYMKIAYVALYNTNNEICKTLLGERGLNAQPFLRKTWTDMVEAYMVEAEWAKSGKIPTFEDYMENRITTSGAYMALVHLFFLVSDGVIPENTQDLLDPYPKFFILGGTILGLWDDLGTAKEEHERGDVLSSTYLLMKKNNITCEEEGRKEILRLIHTLWNDLNVELVTPNVSLLPTIKVALNMSRASQVVYQHSDDSYLSSVEYHVETLFYKPIDN